MDNGSPETDRFELERRALLAALLDHVPFDGWTGKAMAAAAEQAGLDAGFAYRAFPRGAIDAIEYFNRVADEDMAAALAEEDLEAMRVRDRIARAVRLRLEQNAGRRDAVRRGFDGAVLSRPTGRSACAASTGPSTRSGAPPATPRPTSTSTPSGACWPASTAPRSSIG